ncbi:MAG: VOC family protein [Planctomycetes bacterium]|nr:VOC family protein [Planctomycetota bacterium]
MKSRIHISLSVSDLHSSVAFYSALFGAEPTKQRDDYANFRLDRPSLHLALVKAPEHASGDSRARHFGIELFDNVNLSDWQARLEQAHMPLKIERQVTCCYAVGNKFWAKDPDGNDWEFWVRSAEAELMKGDSTADCATGEAACCTPQQAEVAVTAAKVKDEAPCCTPDTAGKSGCC